MAEGVATHGKQSRRIGLAVLFFANWTFKLFHDYKFLNKFYIWKRLLSLKAYD